MIERRGVFAPTSLKVCDFPTPLERSISESLKGVERDLDATLRMSRKHTDVFQWLLIRQVNESHTISTQQFDLYWKELGQDERLQLSVEQLGRRILHRFSTSKY